MTQDRPPQRQHYGLESPESHDLPGFAILFLVSLLVTAVTGAGLLAGYWVM